LDYQAVPQLRVDDYALPPPVEKNRILAVINNRKFRNIITVKISILTDLLDLNRSVRQINEKVVAILKEQVEQKKLHLKIRYLVF